MSVTLTDISNCDLEPIHLPGKIQSHGFLIVTDSQFIIRFLSANAVEFIEGANANLLDKPLQQFELLLNKTPEPGFLIALLSEPDFQNNNPTKIKISSSYFNLVISTSGENKLLEFEHIGNSQPLHTRKMISQSLTGITAQKDLLELLGDAALQVKNIIQFDRVMIYRFAPDGHGEVVVEAKNEGLEPWLGLHYPASDIPQQARTLYKLNMTRLIADVHSVAADIIKSSVNTGTPDLTPSQLRAVSPVHIQYLKNMGVASSFSISLIYKKELWGLIACHNYSTKFIDYESRESSKLIGQLLSFALECRQDDQNLELREYFHNKVNILSGYLHSNSSIADALTGNEINLLHVAHASGAVLIYEKKIWTVGITPAEKELESLVKWISETQKDTIFYTAALSAEYAPAKMFQKNGSGILVITLSKELDEYIIWLRPEVIQQVKWAGNPDKTAIVSTDGTMNISPRHSFDTWIKEVAATSQPWTAEEIKSALRLKEEILSSINIRASAIRLINERLQNAYEELDTFSYTISHDLKTPITAIKGYSQLLSARPDLAKEDKKILERIEGRADRMNYMIKAVLDYSRIGRLSVPFSMIDTGNLVKEIVQDMEQVYHNYGTLITVGDTPPLRGDAAMIWQVFNNLIGNAVKYSQNVRPPRVHIEGRLTEKQIFYTIKDNGIGIAQKDLDQVFLLFSRMDNVREIEGTGVGLAIVKKIVEKHNGNIWAESELGKGTTFFLSFNNE